MIVVKEIFKTYIVRHTCSSVAALLIAGIMQHFFSYSNAHWMVFSAFMMCQVSRGAPIRQALIMIAIMLLALIMANILMSQDHFFVHYIILSLIYFMTGMVVLVNRPLIYRYFVAIILFMIVFTSVVLQQGMPNNILPNQLIDLILGSFIGIACGVMVLPIRVIDDFYDGLLQVLKLLRIYMQQLSDCYKEGRSLNKEQSLQMMHKMMLAKSNAYPEWVYDVGFNRLLRSGFRYYLIVIDRIIEILNSIELLSYECKEYELVTDYGLLLAEVMDQNQYLVAVVSEFIELKKVSDLSQDFVSDINSLELTLQSLIPAGLDLIELTPQFIKTTALVRDMRDLRDLLLKLVVALPIEHHKKV